MFRSLFGSSKKVKEDDVAEPEPQNPLSDYIVVEPNSGTNQPGLYPPLYPGNLPYSLLPANVATTNVHDSDSNKRDNYLDDIPFQLSPLLTNEHKGDLKMLLLKSKSILESKQEFMYDYSFDLERSVLRH